MPRGMCASSAAGRRGGRAAGGDKVGTTSFKPEGKSQLSLLRRGERQFLLTVSRHLKQNLITFTSVINFLQEEVKNKHDSSNLVSLKY